ncbi:MAG: YbhB/YbcL family Raf kinase inhibitor-like protein [Gammaproteobacteria bacterium]|nr:YbhB/YbcL family Raf kinase inhibitor-like protein [Gammaproteobacteria bacterium]
MKLTSNAFLNGELIPRQYTCDGSDLSPQLHWNGAPENTRSFVLIVDDPDAPMGNWDHWLLFNIPSNVNQLKENIAELPSGTNEGKNSWEKTGYGGPCPPSNIHRYFFKLYALDNLLPLKNGVTKEEIIKAMQGHILAHAELLGRYERHR